MAKKDGFYYIRGKGYWMKVLGAPQPNYNKDGKEWTFELEPDEDGQRLLNDLGLSDRVNKGENKDRILFRQRELRRDGSANRPISVVGLDGRPWDQNELIGNESIIDVKFKFQVNNGRKDSIFPQAIRVLEHVPYERQEFAPINEDDEFFRAPVEEVEED